MVNSLFNSVKMLKLITFKTNKHLTATLTGIQQVKNVFAQSQQRKLKL